MDVRQVPAPKRGGKECSKGGTRVARHRPLPLPKQSRKGEARHERPTDGGGSASSRATRLKSSPARGSLLASPSTPLPICCRGHSVDRGRGGRSGGFVGRVVVTARPSGFTPGLWWWSTTDTPTGSVTARCRGGRGGHGARLGLPSRRAKWDPAPRRRGVGRSLPGGAPRTAKEEGGGQNVDHRQRQQGVPRRCRERGRRTPARGCPCGDAPVGARDTAPQGGPPLGRPRTRQSWWQRPWTLARPQEGPLERGSRETPLRRGTEIARNWG